MYAVTQPPDLFIERLSKAEVHFLVLLRYLNLNSLKCIIT